MEDKIEWVERSRRWRWTTEANGEQVSGWADTREEAEQMIEQAKRPPWPFTERGPRTPWGAK